MSTVLRMSAFPPAPYGLKEKSVESFAPAFTSVNGRSSVSPTNEQTPAPTGGPATWSPVPRPQENGYHSPSESISSISSSGNTSPESSTNKRRRSDSAEHSHVRRSPDGSTTSQTVYRSVSRDEPSTMDNPQQHSLPPSDRAETEKRWADSHDMPHHGYQEIQHRESRPTEPSHNGVSSLQHVSMGALNDSNSVDERDSTRPGVQVDLKKRKRQFANRTKTGCGTCRRRKKKCDEAKPECNNCTRGGFICEGYANKIPWPKNGVTKPPPPLQAKERMSVEVSSVYARCPVCNQIHIPHCEAPRQSSYPETHQVPNGSDGARGRPINVEDHDRKPSAPSSWNGWSEQQPPPPRPAYQPEPPPATQYSQPHSNHERQPSHEHQMVSHQRQDLPPQRQPPSGRVYHHTPQSMSQVVTNLPAASPYPLPNSSTTPAANEPSPRHQVVQHSRQPPPPPPPSSMAPSTAAPPGPTPSHYPQQSIMHKSEKEKMLAGEPFMPFDMQLTDERHHCIGAVYRFNSTSNAAVNIASDERARSFRTIVAARWIPPRNHERVVSHLGGNVQVTTPFHCDYGYNLSIAENVVIGSGCQLLDSARICIGRNTRIGARVTISTLKTPTDTKSLKGSNGTEIAQQVWIGENVYIGDGVIIEAGVRIGDHAIVRPGSVVVRDLPPNCVAHGNPAFG